MFVCSHNCPERGAQGSKVHRRELDPCAPLRSDESTATIRRAWVVGRLKKTGFSSEGFEHLTLDINVKAATKGRLTLTLPLTLIQTLTPTLTLGQYTYLSNLHKKDAELYETLIG